MSRFSSEKMSRRQVLKAVGSVAVVSAFPAVVPSTVFGKSAPSNRINVGMIGMGRQAMYANLPLFLQSEDVRVAAVCDVDRWRLDNAK